MRDNTGRPVEICKASDPVGPGERPTPAHLLTRREVIRDVTSTLAALGGGTMLSVVPDVWAAAAPEFVGPHPVRAIENTWIPMPDGVKLAARIWLPEGAEQHPVPAILNYCPYFARFFTRAEDETRYPYYAAHGYACVRVDIRGSGDSAGYPLDEYVALEQDDGVEIIRWIAAQRWCTGAVGMEGKSWSGFNALQVAARRPPALKAIITHCSTDNRYTDDAHYKGGCVLSDMFGWGTHFLAFQGSAPDPDITGNERWRERWLERLNAVDFNVATWLTHQHRDAFWQHGSVVEDYSRIVCPVYAIGGWVDAYKNPVFRLLAGLTVPRKGLIGPWSHVYPHRGIPGPAIDYLDEALRWWDHWLKNAHTGIMDEPMLRVWMQDKPATPGEERVPGYWAAEEVWPSKRITRHAFFLNAVSNLEGSQAAGEAVVLHPIQTVGNASGNWCPSGGGSIKALNTELSRDQRLDDARSLVFDSSPLKDSVEILGACELTLHLAVDKPVAFIAVRLNEILPTGESSRVTYGILNLCHRDSDAMPSALEPGRRYTVKLSLDNAAHRFHAGNRIRVSISTTYWPLVLPAPEPVTLTLFTGLSQMTLPVRPPRAEDAKLRAFGPAFVPPVAIQSISSQPATHIVEWNAVNEQQVTRDESDDAVLLTAVGTRLIGKTTIFREIADRDVAGSIQYEHMQGWEREKWRPRVVASSKITTTKTDFLLSGELNAFDGEEKIFARTWNRTIPRQLV